MGTFLFRFHNQKIKLKFSKMSLPRLYTILRDTFKIDTKKAGEQLAALLIERINGEPVDLLRETDPAILYPGESDGSPTVSSKELSYMLEKAKMVKF